MSSLAYSEVWPKIVRLASGLSRHNAGGAMLEGVRQIQPPATSMSCGIRVRSTTTTSRPS